MTERIEAGQGLTYLRYVHESDFVPSTPKSSTKCHWTVAWCCQFVRCPRQIYCCEGCEESQFKHCGVVVNLRDEGNICVNPTYIEQRLFIGTHNSGLDHQLTGYTLSLKYAVRIHDGDHGTETELYHKSQDDTDIVNPAAEAVHVVICRDNGGSDALPMSYGTSQLVV